MEEGVWSALAWAPSVLSTAAKLLSMGLVFLTDQLASFLGHPWVRAYYHLWLAALVVFGPLLQFHVDPRIIFANRNNYFYVRFVDSAWSWTCLLCAGFLLCLSCLGRTSVLRPLLRLGVASTLQLACVRAFGLLRDATGSCFWQCEAGLLLVGEVWDQAACLGSAGRLWRGYTVSVPCFLLSFASLLLLEELAPFRAYLGSGRPAPASLRLLFLLSATLLLLWSALLLLSAVFFHTYSQKLVAAGCAQLCWRLTYCLWYQGPWSPGLPGLGLGRERIRACVCGAGQKSWDPATQTLWYRE